MISNPKSSRNEIVGTTKRSIATMPSAWLRRNVFHPCAPSPRHILGDAGLADLDAELEKLSMDSRRFPQRVGDAQPADQRANFQRYSWSAVAVRGFAAPIRSETGTCQRMTVSGSTIVNASMV